jgi:hypothetical protein
MRGKNEEKLQEIETSLKEIHQKSSNGFPIPVKFEYAEVWYDLESNEYYVIVKIGTKKISFKEVK